MRRPAKSEQEIELRQHDVRHLFHGFDLDRRDFVKLLGGGLMVCLCRPNGLAQESGAARRAEDLPEGIDAWLHIGEDGTVTAYTGKVEMGQNIRTSLAQQVAEELRVPGIRNLAGDGGYGPDAL
jgi:isoquinoline 1-oxidoreductase